MPSDMKLELPDLDTLKEKRGEVRYGLSGLVPATVKSIDGKDLDVVMLDVSRGGLGLLATDFANRVGDTLRLCIEGQDSIDMTVRWMRQPRLGDSGALLGLTRVGLAAHSNQENLVQRLEPFSCIDH